MSIHQINAQQVIFDQVDIINEIIIEMIKSKWAEN